ncbi:ABC transporter B family protein [Quillaja saponaria]|uniref:ABC transporter B family protein n=1 Tax=Quillaja saponaria TaxID=32244 RepID=A0AAD7LG26_QUISA|nr:ABC transporter B family protein [Quillaja saponaria]
MYKVVHRCSNNKGALEEGFVGILESSATIVAGLVVAFAANWELAMLTLIFIPLILICGWIQVKYNGDTGTSSETKHKLQEEAGQIAKDAIENIGTIVSLCAENQVMQLFSNKSQCY